MQTNEKYKHGLVVAPEKADAADLSRSTTLEQKDNSDGRTFYLVHQTPGWRSAGSMMRWQSQETWRVYSWMGGATVGRESRDEAEIREYFEAWTNQ